MAFLCYREGWELQEVSGDMVASMHMVERLYILEYLFSPCACAYVYMYTDVSVGSSCVCGPRGQQLTLDIFTQESFTFIFELRSFICSVLTKLVRLTCQQGLWICGLFYSRTRITSAHNLTYCVLGTQLVLQEPCTLPIGH